jgi:transposase-like protein
MSSEKSATTGPACPSEACEGHGSSGNGSIVLHGFFSKVKWGRRRRYRCTAGGRTFGATTGTPYKRLQHPKAKFDRVAAMSVEGISKSAIARIEHLDWNTVTPWLELAAVLTRKFNAAKLRGYDLVELQLDELNTFLGKRKQQTWVYAGIEVWSRLWPGTLVGPRTWRKTKSFIRNIEDSSMWSGFALITSDGMKFYASAIQLTFGVGCVHAQVIKKTKQNRVVKVGTKLMIGSK